MSRWLTRFALLLVAVASPVPAATVTEVHYVMGTYFRITAEDADAARARVALQRCFATARRFDARFSRFDPDSELSRINRAHDDHIIVSGEMADLLRRARALEKTTAGAFDVTVGALSDLWRTTPTWPTRKRIDAARQTAGRGALAVRDHTLVRRPGMQIDVDGIAKGWAVDRCVEQLRADGIKRALLSFGESSLYALGAPHDAGAWRVTLRGLDPETSLGTLALRDQAVSVSAVLGHARQIGATRIGHIIDPRTGMPLASPAMAVVVAASATDAEALSKAVLVRSSTGEPPAPPVITDVVAPAAGRWPIQGALLIRPNGIQMQGRVRFTPLRTPQPISAQAEPLR